MEQELGEFRKLRQEFDSLFSCVEESEKFSESPFFKSFQEKLDTKRNLEKACFEKKQENAGVQSQIDDLDEQIEVSRSRSSSNTSRH